MRVSSDYQSSSAISRRSRHRVLLYVGMLVLVLIAMQAASRPESWSWLSPSGGGAAGDEALSEVTLVAVLDDTAAADDSADASIEDDSEAAVTDVEAAVTDVEAVPSTSEETGEPDPATVDVTLPAELLSTLTDRVAGITSEEAAAYWRALANVDQLPAESFHAVAQDGVAFAEIVRNSQEHWGEVFTVRGRLRRLEAVEAPPNEYGIETLYEGWMSTTDSRDNPWRLLATRLPDGVEMGDKLSVQIEVTGYYYRLYGYKATSGYRLAPLLIVSDVKLFPSLPTLDEQGIFGQVTKWVVLIVGAVSLAALLLIFAFSLNERRYRKRRVATDPPHQSQPPTFNPADYEFHSAAGTEDAPGGEAESSPEESNGSS